MKINKGHLMGQDQYLIAHQSGINAGKKLSSVHQSSSTKKKTGPEEFGKNLDEMHKFYTKDGKSFTEVKFERGEKSADSGKEAEVSRYKNYKYDQEATPDGLCDVKISYYKDEYGRSHIGSASVFMARDTSSTGSSEAITVNSDGSYTDSRNIASTALGLSVDDEGKTHLTKASLGLGVVGDSTLEVKEAEGAKTYTFKGDNVQISLTEVATEAHKTYAKQLEPAKAQMKEIFGEHGEVMGRAKNPVSAANRLKRVIEAKDWGPDRIDTPEQAVENLWDAIGTRIVLNDTTPQGIQKAVDSMATGIRTGKLEMTHLNNLRGKGGIPYFSDEQIKQIRQADAERRAELKAQGEEPGKPIQIGNSERTEGSPFTCVCGYVKHGDGVIGEVQIIGPKTLKLADAEHLPYDAMIDKDLYRELSPEGKKLMEPHFEPFRQAINSLDEDGKKVYNEYLNQSYIHARKVELGEPSEPPKVPDGMSEELHMMHIVDLHEKYSQVKKKHPAE